MVFEDVLALASVDITLAEAYVFQALACVYTPALARVYTPAVSRVVVDLAGARVDITLAEARTVVDLAMA